MISLDIRGAFDNARWSIIINTLATAGLLNYFLGTIQSYLTNRIAKFEGTTLYLTRGCPQGSVLGPLLWNASFNSVLDPISGAHIQAFADDTLVICRTDDPGHLVTHTKNITNEIINRLSYKGLQLNTDKSECLIFNDLPRYWQLSPEPDDPDELQVSIEDTSISPQLSLRFLGLQIEDQLSWQTHINKCINKASTALPILTSLFLVTRPEEL